MTENLTKAKELYQDIVVALSSQNVETHCHASVQKEVLRLAFELYLLVEHGEKLCVERGKIKDRPEEHISAIIERCTKAFEENTEERERLASGRRVINYRTCKNYTV